jgi:hypothetical protein
MTAKVLTAYDGLVDGLRAEIAALMLRCERADGAIQKTAMWLGSTDEWADQETMIADFEDRLTAVWQKLSPEDRVSAGTKDDVEAIRAKDREIERLSAERDEAIRQSQGYLNAGRDCLAQRDLTAKQFKDYVDRSADDEKVRLAARDREIAALREALTPFAEAHFYYSDAGKPDDTRTGIGGVTYGDFRRAVSALAALSGPPAPDPTDAMRAVQQWMSSKSLATGHGDTAEDMLNEAEWQIAEAIRAKCEEIAREYTTHGKWTGALQIADRIAALKSNGKGRS